MTMHPVRPYVTRTEREAMYARILAEGRRPTAAELNAVAEWQPGCRCFFADHPTEGTVLVWDPSCPTCPTDLR